MGEEQTNASVNINSWSNLEDDDDLLLLNDDLNLNTSSLRSDERYMGFDNNVGDTWIYPSNFPERAYQYNIVQKALFHNTLVVLPTGLGKTFIAAVVMYNMYRWYPMGKVIFMAPTRPLVAQQIEACCKIVGIPKCDSVEITGKLSKASRAQLWQSKRVFFATPQSVQSDIMDTELNFPFHATKLIVVDEAHRAKGRYAYTDVISNIWRKNKFFRILALSATPGRRKDDVEEVIRNLFISNLEVRTEDSVDVISYVHKRQMKTVVVKLGPKLNKIRDELLEIADPHLRNLIENRLIAGRPGSISRNWLVMEHKKFRESLVNNRVPGQKELNSDFSICISVYHAIELLERHGLRVFLNNFDESQDGGAKFVVILRPDLRRLIERVREEAGPNPFAFSDQSMVNGEIAPIPANIDFGHPKFEIAKDHVLAHFEHNRESRVIIFCEYRESVMLMHRLLLQHRPLIRPRVFVGQGGTGSIRAVTQQQQIKVMNDFRSGESNALIATSVAEEGIDVGEVDLIVCFDINTSNPTRFIQRIGRTGRKKEGKVLLLATEGKEHTVLKEVLSERNKLNKSISRGGEFAAAYYKHAPRMVPTEFNPKCQKTFITQPQSPEPTTNKQKAITKQKGQRIPKIGQQRDLRHFFKQNVILDDEEKCIFESSEAPSSSKVSNSTTAVTFPVQNNESQPIMNFSPPKIVGLSKKSVKKIAKYVRNSLKSQSVDAQKALTTNKLSKDSLRFLLDFSPDILLNVWTRMQDLWMKGIDETNLPIKGITPEGRQTVRVYLQMMNIFGSKENIADFAQKRGNVSKALNFSSLIEKYGFVFNDVRRIDECQDQYQFLMEKFDKMSELFPTDECSKESFVQSAVYDDEAESFIETTRDCSNDFILHSKYMSQWEEQQSHTENGDISFIPELPTPAPTVHNETCKAAAKPKDASNENSDDDVVFVGVAQQSTPIRTNSLKQSILNFSETPIACTTLKRPFKRRLNSKRSQKNCLDFIKTARVSNKSNEDTSSEKNSVRRCTPTPEKVHDPSNGNHMDFFDDQFDDIIAANSGIIERIENSTAISQPNKMDLENETSREASKLSSKSIFETSAKCAPNPLKGSPGVTPSVTNETVAQRTSLGENDSTPDDFIALQDDTNETFDKTAANSAHTTGSHLNPLSEQSAVKNNLNSVHPEIADIDFDNFSETFSDDIGSKTQILPESHKSPQRASPDIFEELFEPIPEAKMKEKSPPKLAISPPSQVSPCLLTKKTLTWRQVQMKYGKASQCEPINVEPSQQNDSVIRASSKIRSKRRIITSESDSSEDDTRKHKDVIPNSRTLVRRNSPKKARIPRKRINEFIDEEAALSGSASEDEFEHTIGCYMADSVVVHDDEAENDMVNMTQVYLQSVRSPSGQSRGTFKIPARRQYNDASKIFSQRVPKDDASYMIDSFVVSDEGSDVDQSICPLERAEQILKERTRAKRKAKLIGDEPKQPAKKKRVLRIHNSSEDDDDFV